MTGRRSGADRLARRLAPSPRRKLILVLTDELEIEASDGEKRRFGPGSMSRVEDATGRGHISRDISTERGLPAAIPLAGP